MRPEHYDLEVWRVSMQLAREIYHLTRQLPFEERYGLCAQMRRAAVSIPSNIAEGTARSSKAELIRFLIIAKGSLMELDTQLLLCHDLALLIYPDTLRASLHRLAHQIHALVRQKQRQLIRRL